MPFETEPVASEATKVPCPSRSRTRAERESTLQVRGVLSARSGAFTSAPLSITAIFTLDAARSTQSGTSPTRESAHCHSQAIPG